MIIPRLHIKVVDGKVTEVRFEMEQGDTHQLNESTDYLVSYEERTERCRICGESYGKSQMVARDGMKLCQPCDNDRYPRDEDIPF